MLCRAKKAFQYSIDGVTPRLALKGDEIELPDGLFPGLATDGFVETIESKALGKSPENKALFAAPENKSGTRARAGRLDRPHHRPIDPIGDDRGED